MTRCDETRARLIFYLDNELEPPECALIRTHLDECGACRGVFDTERRFLEMIRGSKQLPVASPELRRQIEQLVNHPLVAPVQQRGFFHGMISSAHWPKLTALVGMSVRQAVILTPLICLALLVTLWFLSKRDLETSFGRPSDFAVMAAETHQRHLQGQLPLEIISDAPQRISSWFTGKVSFLVKLPNYQESSGQEKLYELEGARLVGYKNEYAAYVAYQMRSRPISLVVTSDSIAQASNGEQILARGITFHYNSIKGWKVITWSDRGLTYALVSDLEERGQQSCIVCHQGTKEQDFIEPLKP